MNHPKLSMRFTHGEMDTFLFGCGEMTKVIHITQKTDVLLKFRHTQYAPFGECNALKNNAIFKVQKNGLSCSTTTASRTSPMVTALCCTTTNTTKEI